MNNIDSVMREMNTIYNSGEPPKAKVDKISALIDKNWGLLITSKGPSLESDIENMSRGFAKMAAGESDKQTVEKTNKLSNTLLSCVKEMRTPNLHPTKEGFLLTDEEFRQFKK